MRTAVLLLAACLAAGSAFADPLTVSPKGRWLASQLDRHGRGKQMDRRPAYRLGDRPARRPARALAGPAHPLQRLRRLVRPRGSASISCARRSTARCCSPTRSTNGSPATARRRAGGAAERVKRRRRRIRRPGRRQLRQPPRRQARPYRDRPPGRDDAGSVRRRRADRHPGGDHQQRAIARPTASPATRRRLARQRDRLLRPRGRRALTPQRGAMRIAPSSRTSSPLK